MEVNEYGISVLLLDEGHVGCHRVLHAQGGPDEMPVRLKNSVLRILNRSLPRVKHLYLPQQQTNGTQVPPPHPLPPPLLPGPIYKAKVIALTFTTPANEGDDCALCVRDGQCHGVQTGIGVG